MKISKQAKASRLIVDEVEIEIGGQRIDKHYGVWMEIWCELTHSQQKEECLNKMIKHTNIFKNYQHQQKNKRFIFKALGRYTRRTVG